MPNADNPIQPLPPDRRSEPPPVRDVGVEFQRVEENLRRYVDYRFADLAPVDGDFYRRHRVEIWSLLILLAIGLHGFFVGRGAPPSADAAATDTPAATASTAPQVPAAQPRPSSEPRATQPVLNDTTSATRSAPYVIDAAAIRANPNDLWRSYVAAHRQTVIAALDDIIAGREARADALSARQLENFRAWRTTFGAEAPVPESTRLQARLGLFEYALMDWHAKAGKSTDGLVIDGLVSATEYPPAVLRLYLADVDMGEAFSRDSDRDPTRNPVRSAVAISWLERTYGESP